jgi:hypothetical protein
VIIEKRTAFGDTELPSHRIEAARVICNSALLRNGVEHDRGQKGRWFGQCGMCWLVALGGAGPRDGLRRSLDQVVKLHGNNLDGTGHGNFFIGSENE